MNESAAPDSVDVGTVLVLGAGAAGIRAAIDLAAAGHRVLLTDDGALSKKVLGVLSTTPPSGQRCGLCPLVIPEEEHEVASYYCMRRSVVNSANIEVVVATRIEPTERGFRVKLPNAAPRTAHSAIVAGTTLEDRAAAERLERLLSQIPGPASEPSPFERARTTKPPVFACGAAVGQTDLSSALLSGSAAASEASRYLSTLGLGRTGSPIDQSPGDDPTRSIAVVPQALVVGATVAGLRAALSLAQRGIEAQVLDPGSELCAWPLLEPVGDERAIAFVAALCDEVRANPLITLQLGTDVVQHAGSVGRFLTVVRTPGEEETLLPHGATILATDIGSVAAAPLPRANGHYDDAALARLFAVEATPEGGQQEASRFKPADFLKLGLFLARPSPSLATAVTNGEAAAQRAFRFLAWNEISVQRVVAAVRTERCTECKDCLSLCPYEARKETPAGRVVLDAAVCEGCGLCAAYCPSAASELPGPLDSETMALVEATLAATRRILP